MSMSRENADRIIDDIIRIGATHVVLTGGEPFLNYGVLLHCVKRLAGINISCNSNLTLVSKRQLRELKRAGLPHILTSLAASEPEVNDYIFGSKGSFLKIIENIRNAVNEGIKVSVNTIVTKQNRNYIYETGCLVAILGASNFFVTRAVPPSNCPRPEEFMLDDYEYYAVLDTG